MPKKISTLFLILLLLLAPVLIVGQDKELEESKKRLLQIQQQINEEKEREEKVRATEKREKQALGTVNKNLEKTKGELKKYSREIISTKKDLRITEINLKKGEEDLRNYQDLLAGRISAFYRNIFSLSNRWNEVEQGYLNSLSSDVVQMYNVRGLGKGLKVFGVFARENAALIRETGFQKKVIEDKKKVLKTKEVKLTQIKVAKEKEERKLKSEKREKESSISKAKVELKKFLEKQEQLRKAAKELEGMIKKLAAKKSVSPDILKKEAMLFERDKDNLPWPVSKGKVINYFGWSSSQHYATSIFNPGVDIEVRGSENVCAVSKGKVLFGGSFRSYGKTVIIDHGGSYCSVYSGLDQISVKTNQEMKNGQILGNVSSILHFEMRKDAKAIDPLEWLRRTNVY